jgi:transitional endoplasmic reticulum ATPase
VTRSGSRRLTFGLVAAGFIVLYAVVAGSMWRAHTWNDDGPLSRLRPAMTEFRAPFDRQEALRACHFDEKSIEPKKGADEIRAGIIDGNVYYGCYQTFNDGKTEWAWVRTPTGETVGDTDLIKRSGAWRWIGLVKTAGDLVYAAGAVVGGFVVARVYYRIARPGAPKGTSGWRRGRGLVALAVFPVVGWFVLVRLKRVTRARKVRAVFQASFGWTVFVLGALNLGEPADALSVVVVTFVVLGFVVALGAGRFLLAPAGFGLPEGWIGTIPSRSSRRPRRSEQNRLPSTDVNLGDSTGPAAAPTVPVTAEVDVVSPSRLPSFRDVGGMSQLKQELRDTIGLFLAFSGEAEVYKLTWNGVLLHGRPGVGKTFVARAAAGEFGLNFIHASAGDVVSSYRGESGRNVDELFATAARSIPCLLFFDEFDSIAVNREDWPDQEVRRTVGQLLQSLEEYRDVRELIVMAATNHLDRLDPAVVRPGRFDRLIRVDLPDHDARASIFEACLRDRPMAGRINYGALAGASSGLTPAAIAQAVEAASMRAFRSSASSGDVVPLTTDALMSAIVDRGGEDRPTVENVTWDDIVLAPDVKDELQEMQFLLEDPALARKLGVDAPSGLLLCGPPGTGKTTLARVLAAQAKCSFYPVSAAEVTSMWLGESEKNIQRLFDRARENRPSIIFIDEIDAIASKRGEWGSYDRQINELLIQIDGLSSTNGVFVVAATNRPDQLDPALLRGGRLSRTIEIPLPDESQRAQLLALFTKSMPLEKVSLATLAADTGGASGADLEALCQQAGLRALVRIRHAGTKQHYVTSADFERALQDWHESRAATD